MSCPRRQVPWPDVHAAWLTFATSAEPTSVIRAFRARQIKRGGAVLRAGYVIDSSKRRGAFFLTVYKEMDGEDGW